MKTITPDELHLKMKEKNGITILDVRAEEKYEKEHIEQGNIQSINIPKSFIFNLDEHPESISDLPKDKEIIVTCTTGNSARKCASILQDKGYNVTLLEGGITAWKEYQSHNKNI